MSPPVLPRTDNMRTAKSLLIALTASIALLGAAAPQHAGAQSADATAAAPMTAAEFREFIRLLNSGDPRHAEYYTADVTPRTAPERDVVFQVTAPDKDRTTTLSPEQIYIDDKKDMMAVIMSVRHVAKRDGVQLGSQPRSVRAGDALTISRVLFVGLSNGKISSLRAATDRVLPAPEPALPAGDETEPLPATARQPLMSRAKFEDYLRLFTRWDRRFVEYYDPNVVFDTQPSPKPLYGRQAIVDLYTPIRRNLDEHIVAGDVVVDNANGMMVAEIRNRMTAERGDVELPSGVMRRGATRDRWGVILYSLNQGKISRIRGGAPTETFEPAGSKTSSN